MHFAIYLSTRKISTLICEVNHMSKDLVRKNILDITPYQPGKPIEEVQREIGIKKIVKLASNESPLGPSSGVIRAIKDGLSRINRYPEGGCSYLKKKLAEKLGVNASCIIVGNGSDEIITFALRAFVEEKDEVIVAHPSFLIYEIAAKVCNADIVRVPLKNFRYDLKRMKEAIREKTKIIFIANPDNPTGSYVNKQEVEEFLQGLPENLIVYFDEAYFEFTKELGDFPDTLAYLKNKPRTFLRDREVRDKKVRGKNIIVTRSFSKAYGLAGLRVGYGVSCPELISYMNRVREPFNVNSLAQAAAIVALEDEAHLELVRRVVSEGKKYLCRSFDKLGFRYIPSATNFILVDVERPGEEVYRQLLKLGIIVRDMKAWELDNFIRVTVGTMAENRRFIKALEKVVTS